MHPSHHAKTTPEKAAYIMAGSGETVTFAQLESRSNQIAHAFRTPSRRSNAYEARRSDASRFPCVRSSASVANAGTRTNARRNKKSFRVGKVTIFAVSNAPGFY